MTAPRDFRGTTDHAENNCCKQIPQASFAGYSQQPCEIYCHPRNGSEIFSEEKRFARYGKSAAVDFWIAENKFGRKKAAGVFGLSEKSVKGKRFGAALRAARAERGHNHWQRNSCEICCGASGCWKNRKARIVFRQRRWNSFVSSAEKYRGASGKRLVARYIADPRGRGTAWIYQCWDVAQSYYAACRWYCEITEYPLGKYAVVCGVS